MSSSKIIGAKAKKVIILSFWTTGWQVGLLKIEFHVCISLGYNNYLQKPIIGIRNSLTLLLFYFEEKY